MPWASYSLNSGLAVNFAEPGQFSGPNMALHRSGIDFIEVDALRAPILTETNGLLFAGRG